MTLCWPTLSGSIKPGHGSKCRGDKSPHILLVHNEPDQSGADREALFEQDRDDEHHSV